MKGLLLLGDFATTDDQGRVWAAGVGIDVLTVPALPHTRPNLALVARLHFEPGELGRAVHIEIRSLDPAGSAIHPAHLLLVEPQRDDSRPERSVPFQFVVHFRDLQFRTEGRHSFQLLAAGNLIETADLWLTVRPETRGPGADIVNQLLSRGYRAFLDGDPVTARSLFEDIVQRFPTSAAAHNNLGFMALSSGEHDTALREFRRAEELGYGDRWLLRPNMACCLYLAGDLPAAASGFEDAMLGENPGEGVLFAIGGTELFSIQVKAPLDYIALMALNATWSALGLGDLGKAQLLRGTAEAGRLGFGHDEASKGVFARSLDQLAEALADKSDASF